MLVARQRANRLDVALEVCDYLRRLVPLVDHKVRQLSRHHDVAVLWHVEHVCDDILLLVK